jgi:hypothetical protein
MLRALEVQRIYVTLIAVDIINIIIITYLLSKNIVSVSIDIGDIFRYIVSISYRVRKINIDPALPCNSKRTTFVVYHRYLSDSAEYLQNNKRKKIQSQS